MGKGVILSRTTIAIMGQWIGAEYRIKSTTKYNWLLGSYENYQDLYSCKTTPPSGRSRKHHGMIEKLNKRKR